MRMKNADEKITDEKITNDNMRMMKSLWTEMNLLCFRIVLLGNNLGHVAEFRPREVQHLFLFNHKNDQNIFTRAQLKKKENERSW